MPPISAQVARAMEVGSWIRRMFEEGLALKQRYGPTGVFDLSLGNPVLEPPPAFYEALRALAQNPVPGMHRYMPNAGYPETRQAVADYLARHTGLPFTAQDIVMTCGAGGAMNVALRALLDPGDEVVFFAPYFPEYPYYVGNFGGVPVVCPTDEAFLPDPSALERALSPRTRVVLLNSPNNPTGVLYPPERLSALAEVLDRHCRRHGRTVYLLSDEPYARLVYDGADYPSPLRFYPATLVATSFSKDLSLAGERIGYLALSPHCPHRDQVREALVFCNRTLGFVNAPALMQRLVQGLLEVTVDISAYQRKRDFLWEHLTRMGYWVVRPQGAFYMFPRSPLPDDQQFVRMLQEERVLVTPGSGFGTPGYFRISYSVEDWVLEGALEGFSRVARRCGLPG